MSSPHMTRPSTPPQRNADGTRTITVHTCCPRCGRDLGDATEGELDVAVAGGRLDYRGLVAECGCEAPAQPQVEVDEHKAGVIQKYKVERLDDPEGKHVGCRYFVLDPQHDPHALAALGDYGASCENEYPTLAKEIYEWVWAIEAENEKAEATPVPPPVPPVEVGSWWEHSNGGVYVVVATGELRVRRIDLRGTSPVALKELRDGFHWTRLPGPPEPSDYNDEPAGGA